MRNLLGRLHARPAGDLARIALFWRVPLGDAARPSQVGTLYRAMVDPRAVRSVWDRLDPEAREMVRLLAVTDEQGVALGLAALAAALGWEPRMDLDALIQETIDYYKAHSDMRGANARL